LVVRLIVNAFKEDVILDTVRNVKMAIIIYVMENHAMKIKIACHLIAKMTLVLFALIRSMVNIVIAMVAQKTVIVFLTLATIRYAPLVQIPHLLFVTMLHAQIMETVLQAIVSMDFVHNVEAYLILTAMVIIAPPMINAVLAFVLIIIAILVQLNKVLIAIIRIVNIMLNA
jgi:hypothetical protein